MVEASLSPEVRAARYRAHAAKLQQIAGSRPASTIRDQLLAVARQYLVLANSVAGRAPSSEAAD